jgi:hypothetical protein
LLVALGRYLVDKEAMAEKNRKPHTIRTEVCGAFAAVGEKQEK